MLNFGFTGRSNQRPIQVKQPPNIKSYSFKYKKRNIDAKFLYLKGKDAKALSKIAVDEFFEYRSKKERSATNNFTFIKSYKGKEYFFKVQDYSISFFENFSLEKEFHSLLILSEVEEVNVPKPYMLFSFPDLIGEERQGLVMERVPNDYVPLNTILSHYIKERHTPFLSDTLLPIMKKTASIIGFLHSLNISHGDVHAHNFLINRLDFNDIYIIDFESAEQGSLNDVNFVKFLVRDLMTLIGMFYVGVDFYGMLPSMISGAYMIKDDYLSSGGHEQVFDKLVSRWEELIDIDVDLAEDEKMNSQKMMNKD